MEEEKINEEKEQENSESEEEKYTEDSEKKKIISDLMLEEHGRINKKMALLENNLGSNSEELSVLLKEFKQELEYHFHIEEEAIFDLYNKISETEEVADTFELMQEHGELMGNIKHIQKQLKEGEEYIPKNNILALKEKLNQHIAFENKTFYKELDEKLDEQEKEDLINHIKNRNKEENSR